MPIVFTKDREMEEFNTDDIYACWPFHADYLVEILNGTYDLEQARNDLRSLIGSKYDARNNQAAIKPSNPVAKIN